MDEVELEKHKSAFITFRAHVSEPKVFEDFLTIFLTHISLRFPIYSYAIESDDSPDRHLHIFFLHQQKDNQKLEQALWKQKYFEDFKKSLKLKQTNIKYALDVKVNVHPEDHEKKLKFSMTIEDKMKILGYIHKNINRRTKTQGLSQNLITKSCEYYHATKRQQPVDVEDLTIINGKNYILKCEHFAKQNNKSVHDWDLVMKMTHQRHSFQLSVREQKKQHAELKFMNKDYDEAAPEVDIIMEFQEEYHQTQLEAYVSYLTSMLDKNLIEHLTLDQLYTVKNPGGIEHHPAGAYKKSTA